MTEERCDNCGKPIDKSQAACVYKEKIVCEFCDKQLRDYASQLKKDDPDHDFAFFVVFICGAAIVAELAALVFLFLKTGDNTLPSGPIEVAMAQRLANQQAAKLYMLIDAAMILVTLVALLLSMILNTLYKIHHRLRLGSLNPPLD
jgi:TctA family transporter